MKASFEREPGRSRAAPELEGLRQRTRSVSEISVRPELCRSFDAGTYENICTFRVPR